VEEDFVIAKTIINSVMSPNFGIIDVGSHEGDFVSFIMGGNSADRAIMIEPIPDKVQILNARFPHAKIVQCAISDIEEKKDLFVTVNFPKCSALYDRQAFDEVEVLNDRTTIQVDIRRLDNVLREVSFLDLKPEQWYLKIDTEGFEIETVNSLGDFIFSNKIVAGQFEYGGCWKERNIKISDMIEKLESAGFETFRGIFKDQNLYFVKVTDTSDDYSHTNLYFIRKSLIKEEN
jgi:FkbM family methyltransferase